MVQSEMNTLPGIATQWRLALLVLLVCHGGMVGGNKAATLTLFP